jgi:hypothetical protein
MKKGFVVAIATGMAFVLTAGPGSAHDTTTDTAVHDLVAERFQGNPMAPTEISGQVASKRSCRRGRRVTAFHDVLPEGPGQEDFNLGSDVTDKDGKFSLVTPFAPDRVYVVVEGRVKRGRGHRHKCEGHTSQTVPVGAYK